MSKKSGLERAANVARHAKAAKDIIKALLQGGWGAAAMQALKHYWPQLLTVGLVLLFLPILLFCCLPMTMFGFGSADDAAVSAMTQKAQSVSAIYDRYAAYIDEYAEEIRAGVTENTKTDPDGSDVRAGTALSDTVIEGEKIQKNRFIALHAVSVGNDLNRVDAESVKVFARRCVAYRLEDAPEKSESAADATDGSGTEPEMPQSKILILRYLSPEEIMTAEGYTEADRSWAELIYTTLETGGMSDE